MKLSFYINSKSFFASGIRFKQRFFEKSNNWGISHVEIQFNDGVWFSSSEVDGGVRSKEIKDDKGNWVHLELDLSLEEQETIRKWCESKKCLKYDKAGIFFAQMLGTMWFLHPEKYFCSEFCTGALHQIGWLCGIPAYSVSPAKLYEIVNKKIKMKKLDKLIK